MRRLCFYAICMLGILPAWLKAQCQELQPRFTCGIELGAFLRFAPNTNSLGGTYQQRFWYPEGADGGLGAAMTYHVSQHLFIGANGHLRVLGSNNRIMHRNYNRGHVVLGGLTTWKTKIVRQNDLPTFSQIGAQAEVGRIGGSNPDIKGDTWNIGGTVFYNFLFTERLGITLKGSWYWHHEDLNNSFYGIIPQRDRLIGFRAGIQYRFNANRNAGNGSPP